MLNTSLVSVIIPTYKRESILRAINSVLEQDYPNIEIIVVDDNAEHLDYRKKVEESLSELINDGKVKLIQTEKNLGGALARNEGIYASSGEFIAFLDDDDWYLPGKISKQVETLKNSDAAMVYCWSRGETSNGDVVWHNHKSSEGVLPFQAMIDDCIASTSLIMCKREALYNVGLFEDMPCKQDVFLELKLAVNGYEFKCIQEELVVYGNCDEGFQRISNVSEKTVIGFNKVRDYSRNHYDLLSKKEAKYVESVLSFKLCQVAKAIKNKQLYKKEMKISLRNQRNPRRIVRLLLDFVLFK